MKTKEKILQNILAAATKALQYGPESLDNEALEDLAYSLSEAAGYLDKVRMARHGIELQEEQVDPDMGKR